MSIFFLTNCTFANNDSDTIFTIEGLNLNNQNVYSGGNNGKEKRNGNELLEEEGSEKVGSKPLTKEMKTLIQQENSDLTNNGGGQMFLVDQNNDGVTDVVKIQNFTYQRGKTSYSGKKYILRQYNKNLNFFETTDEVNEIDDFYELYKNGKLIFILPIGGSVNGNKLSSTYSSTNNVIEALFAKKTYMILDGKTNRPLNRDCHGCDYGYLTSYGKLRGYNHYYGIYNVKNQKNLDYTGLNRGNIKKFYWVGSTGINSEIRSNNTLYGDFQGGNHDINQFNTNGNIEGVQGQNDDKTFNFKLLEGGKLILNVKDSHGLYNMGTNFQSHGHNDAISFENFSTQNGEIFQKLSFLQFDGEVYKTIFKITSVNVSGFSIGGKKFLIIKRLDGKAYLYQFDQEKNTYVISQDIEGDEFEMLEIEGIKYLLAKDLISKTDGLGFVSLFKFNGAELQKLTENKGIVSDSIVFLQDNGRSIGNMKNRVFGFQKGGQLKVYYLNQTTNTLQKINNGSDNTGYLINSNGLNNSNRFICFGKICVTNSGEQNNFEFFFIDEDNILKRVGQDKQFKFVSYERLVHKDYYIQNNTSYLNKNESEINCDIRNNSNMQNCNNLEYQTSYVTKTQRELYEKVNNVKILNNGGIVLGSVNKENGFVVDGGYYILPGKNLIHDEDIGNSYEGLSQIYGNLFKSVRSYRNGGTNYYGGIYLIKDRSVKIRKHTSVEHFQGGSKHIGSYNGLYFESCYNFGGSTTFENNEYISKYLGSGCFEGKYKNYLESIGDLCSINPIYQTGVFERKDFQIGRSVRKSGLSIKTDDFIGILYNNCRLDRNLVENNLTIQDSNF